MRLQFEVDKKSFASIIEGRNAKKILKKKNDKRLEVYIEFLDNRLLIQEGDFKASFLYSSILEIIEKDEYYILKLVLDYNILIPRLCFISDFDIDKFKEFIRCGEPSQLDEERFRIDTLNGISTIKLDTLKLRLELKDVVKIKKETKFLVLETTNIIFKRILIPRTIFTSFEDEKNFIKSIKNDTSIRGLKISDLFIFASSTLMLVDILEFLMSFKVLYTAF